MTDIEGTWEIQWTDTTNATGAFTLEIQNDGGSYYIANQNIQLPISCIAFVGNANVSDQGATFTMVIIVGGQAGTFSFDIPQFGGGGTFTGMAPTPDGIQQASGTCTSSKVGS